MAHNRTTDFSPEFKHASLMPCAQYTGSSEFASLGVWDTNRQSDLLVVEGTVVREEPVNIILVCTISSDRSYLRAHGNYNPDYDKKRVSKAKMQFTGCRPQGVPVFGDVYDKAIDDLKTYQEAIAVTRQHNFFILKDNSVVFNYNLWERRTTDLDNTASVQQITADYVVDDDFKEDWTATKKTHHCCLMPVYGLDELAIPLEDFPSKLAPGALVEVTFRLYHYAYPDKDTKKVTNDIFSAQVQNVNILKEAPSAPRVPFSPRRPVPKPQRSPIKGVGGPSASERRKAAQVFVRPPDGSGESVEDNASGSAEKKRKASLNVISDSSEEDPAKRLRTA